MALSYRQSNSREIDTEILRGNLCKPVAASTSRFRRINPSLPSTVAHCGRSAAALARLSIEYAIPGVVGVGLVHCSLSAEIEVMIRSSFVPFSFGNELVST